MSLLKNPENTRYSRKNITWLTTLIIFFLLIVSGEIRQEYAPQHIFNSLVALIVLVLGGTIADKKISNKS